MSAFNDEIESFSNDLCDMCPMLASYCGQHECPIGDDIEDPECYFRNEHEAIAKAFEGVPEEPPEEGDDKEYQAAWETAEDIVREARRSVA